MADARGRRVMALAALLLALAAPAQAWHGADGAAAAAAFRQGHERYLAGDFEEAVRRYQAAAAAGLDGPALRYDLGNAWFRAGRPGRAAASWERALRLDPGDEEARANLELVRRPFASRLPWARPEPLGERVSARVSDLAAALAFAVPWLLLWGALAARLRAPAARRPALSLAAALSGLLALGGGLLVAGRAREVRAPRAVVISPEAALREAPSPELAPSLELPEGAPLRALSAEGDWLRVRLPGGLEGWVRREDVEMV